MKFLRKLIGFKGLAVIIFIAVVFRVFMSGGDEPPGAADIIIEPDESASMIATVDEFFAMTDKERDGVSVIEDDDGKLHNLHRVGMGNRIQLSFPRMWTIYAAAVGLDPKSSDSDCMLIMSLATKPIRRKIDGEMVFGFEDKTIAEVLGAIIETKTLSTEDFIRLAVHGGKRMPGACYIAWGGERPTEKITVGATSAGQVFSGKMTVKLNGKVFMDDVNNESGVALKETLKFSPLIFN